MPTRGYTALGWATWKVATRVAKKKIVQSRAKLAAAGAVGAVLVGGLVAARSGD